MSDSQDASVHKDDFLSIRGSKKESNVENENRSLSKFGAKHSVGIESKFKKRASKKVKSKDSNRNKDNSEIPHINSIEIFTNSCDNPAPSDFTDWFFSKINTSIKQKEVIPEEANQEDCENIVTSKIKNNNEHYPYFKDIKFSNITTKSGNNCNDIIGTEMIVWDTKINQYLFNYNIVLVLDYSASMKNIDSSGKMYFQKMREVVAAILSNLK